MIKNAARLIWPYDPVTCFCARWVYKSYLRSSDKSGSVLQQKFPIKILCEYFHGVAICCINFENFFMISPRDAATNFEGAWEKHHEIIQYFLTEAQIL
jgi:hypothetical protein